MILLRRMLVSILPFVILAFVAVPAPAHCDTLDGPVVADARVALANRDIAPVLKWITAGREPELRGAFARTLQVRAKDAAARELADLWFFETLVRLHRAGENAPYTGLKPAGTDPGPAVRAGDQALRDGSTEAVSELVRRQIEAGIRVRFAKALEARKHADHTAEAGRRYVRAYVEFMHYLEAVTDTASGTAFHDSSPTRTPGEHAPAAHSPEHSESHAK